MTAKRTAPRPIGQDANGAWKPGVMTHSELIRELGTATGERRAALVEEAKSRMKSRTYPRFAAHLLLVNGSTE